MNEEEKRLFRQYLDAWHRDVHNAVLVRDERRIAETKSAVLLLESALCDGETDFEWHISDNGRNIIAVFHDAMWNLTGKRLRNFLDGLSVADRLEIDPALDGCATITITFENCLIKIGNMLT